LYLDRSLFSPFLPIFTNFRQIRIGRRSTQALVRIVQVFQHCQRVRCGLSVGVCDGSADHFSLGNFPSRCKAADSFSCDVIQSESRSVCHGGHTRTTHHQTDLVKQGLKIAMWYSFIRVVNFFVLHPVCEVNPALLACSSQTLRLSRRHLGRPGP
jgi:hypothetical protein